VTTYHKRSSQKVLKMRDVIYEKPLTCEPYQPEILSDKQLSFSQLCIGML